MTTKYWQRHKGICTLLLLVAAYNATSPLEDSSAVSYKVKRIPTCLKFIY